MIRDYLRSFWRGILSNKIATFINVGGLALGLAVFFALTFYVYREFSWDEHWEDADRIFQVAGSQESLAGSTASIQTSAPYVLGTTLLGRDAGAFDSYARVYTAGGLLSVDDNNDQFMTRSHVEPALLDILQLDILEGSIADVFADPGGIAIDVRIVERVFGTESPLGRTVTFKSQPNLPPGMGPAPVDFIIKAVYSVPEPSMFASMFFLALLDISGPLPRSTMQATPRLDLWTVSRPQPGGQIEQPFSVAHYFKLREGVDAKALETDLRNFMEENRLMDYGTSKMRYIFRNVQDLHLQPSPFEPGDSVQRLRVYAAIGTLVLLISGCNFVMLATLRLVDRMREVGIRKSVGCGGGQLLFQYLLDAFFHTLVAAALAVLFLGFAFPKLAVMLQLPLRLDIFTTRNLGLCLGMVVLFTLVSSLYPAWMSSQTKPGPLLRNGAGAVVGTGTGLRRLLVTLQFAIVVVLLLASTVVRQQIEYTRTRDPGYSAEGVISATGISATGLQQYAAILNEFRRIPGVEAAAVGASPGTLNLSAPTLVRARGADGSLREAGLQQSVTGADFFRVLSVRVLAGREFSAELDEMLVGQPSATPRPDAPLPTRNILLNAAAVRLLGFARPEKAVGQLLETDVAGPDRQLRAQGLRVVGVVADTQFASVMMPPVPTFYHYGLSGGFSVKVSPGVDLAQVTDNMKAVWDTAVNGTTVLNIRDAGSINAFQLQREEFEARIFTGSTGLAIIIALLGLYGLVAATVVKRVKEIGVRKVMGAERTSIVTLFLIQFSKPIVVANLVAWPFGFWAIKQWLARFPYQLDTFVIVMSGLAASVVALFIAWLTVGAIAARAASVNPVKALRYE